MNASVLTGPKPVDVAAIERELESLWKTLAPADDPQLAMQASVVNLIAIVADPAEAQSAATVISRLISRNPCRAIIVQAMPHAAETDIAAEVSVVCEQGNSERRVYCEQIHFSANEATIDALPNTVASFIIPDLPAVLWFPAPPMQSEWFRAFAAASNRVIIDSATFGHDGMAQLPDYLLHSRATRTAISDLNWARLTPYRQLLAQFFDVPATRELLKNIIAVEIEAQASAASLMAGWLVSRLGRGTAPDVAGNISITLSSERPAVFKSIRLSCEGGEFSVVRVLPEMVEAKSAVGSEIVSRVTRYDLAPVERLLGEEISYSGRDRAYDAAVRAIGELTQFKR